MPLSLRIINSPDGELISEWSKVFPEEGGSVGRSYGSTMQLSDISRSISGTHMIINRGSRGYKVMDVSTNGLFINGSTKPLGKNNSSSLNDGDVLDLGHYRLMISCFVPEQASVKSSFNAASSLSNELGGDPFANDGAKLDEQEESIVLSRDAELSFSAHIDSAMSDCVEIDPFTDYTADITFQTEQFNINQFDEESFDEDPFVVDKSEQLNSLPVYKHMQGENIQSDRVSAKDIEPKQLIAFQAMQQDMMIQAAEMAFNRLMSDITPVHLEAMFKDLIQPGFFSRKPNYWDMYKRYFQHQQDNQDWQLKFKVYFSESLRIKQSFGEK